ncbi:hypothetical protein D1632_06140 [Chryseobacterium nematophagum]|uniref:Fibrobacter succinogenes major paralogous domain-containing protein n=2 Tax=Chryseobacterium nematophagum TaxID=2305228 RepID=A0A3M7L9H8_9FLAO|nr:hypothetical protein D1632_06140 [Chryseobacterium nematophagum]
MSIPISFGSISCNVSVVVTTAGNGSVVNMCMGNNIAKSWMAHNLGADTNLDPNTNVITKGLHGNYYQWGRPVPVADADTSADAIFPWDTSNSAPNTAWNSGTAYAPIKTGFDPCPSGFRIPTRAEWVSLNSNNSPSRLGTFVSDPTNFSSALVYTCGGNKMTLPAAGMRTRTNGTLQNRGSNGYYWSSDHTSNQNGATNALAYGVMFGPNTIDPQYYNYIYRSFGFSVRCISE